LLSIFNFKVFISFLNARAVSYETSNRSMQRSSFVRTTGVKP
jgi:hypothetical protein